MNSIQERVAAMEAQFSAIADKLGCSELARDIGPLGSAYVLYKCGQVGLRLVIDRGGENVEISWTTSGGWFDLNLLMNLLKGSEPRAIFSFDDQIEFINSKLENYRSLSPQEAHVLEAKLDLLASARQRSYEKPH